jgi:hydrogenase-4 component E
MSAILAQTINLLGALLLMLAFAMIAQRRILSLINLFTLQGLRAGGLHRGGRLRHGQHPPLPVGRPHLRAEGVLIPILLHRLVRPAEDPLGLGDADHIPPPC